MSVTSSFIVIFSASADLCSAWGIIIPRAFSKSADAEKIITNLQVTVIYISNFSQAPGAAGGGHIWRRLGMGQIAGRPNAARTRAG